MKLRYESSSRDRRINNAQHQFSAIQRNCNCMTRLIEFLSLSPQKGPYLWPHTCL